MSTKGTKFDDLKKKALEYVGGQKYKEVDGKRVIDGFVDPESYSGVLLSKSILYLTHVTKVMRKHMHPVTKQPYDYPEFRVRHISFLDSSEVLDSNPACYIVAEIGSSNILSNIVKSLGLQLSIRKRQSIKEGFIEFLNTVEKDDPAYDSVLGEDMVSVDRYARAPGHRIREGYADLSEREKKIKAKFRYMAGVKISPPAKKSYEKFSTIQASFFSDDWMELISPSPSEDIPIYLESVLYSAARIETAQKAFETHSSGGRHTP